MPTNELNSNYFEIEDHVSEITYTITKQLLLTKISKQLKNWDTITFMALQHFRINDSLNCSTPKNSIENKFCHANEKRSICDKNENFHEKQFLIFWLNNEYLNNFHVCERQLAVLPLQKNNEFFFLSNNMKIKYEQRFSNGS